MHSVKSSPPAIVPSTAESLFAAIAGHIGSTAAFMTPSVVAAARTIIATSRRERVIRTRENNSDNG